MNNSINVFEEIRESRIPGCYLFRPRSPLDNRGKFVKTFHAATFERYGLEIGFRESFYSVSKKNVLRGMHFQRPPQEHAKLVYCLKGTIFDAFVDLRIKSQGFGMHECVELSDKNGLILYLPPGVAHGFYVLSNEAITVYNVTKEYDPSADSGVHWDSCGIDWPTNSPIISPRDSRLLDLNEVNNLF